VTPCRHGIEPGSPGWIHSSSLHQLLNGTELTGNTGRFHRWLDRPARRHKPLQSTPSQTDRNKIAQSHSETAAVAITESPSIPTGLQPDIDL